MISYFVVEDFKCGSCGFEVELLAFKLDIYHGAVYKIKSTDPEFENYLTALHERKNPLESQAFLYAVDCECPHCRNICTILMCAKLTAAFILNTRKRLFKGGNNGESIKNQRRVTNNRMRPLQGDFDIMQSSKPLRQLRSGVHQERKKSIE